MRIAAACDRINLATRSLPNRTDESFRIRAHRECDGLIQFCLRFVGSAAATSLTIPSANVGIIAIFTGPVN
jgi:hypothetical protein